MAMMAVAHLRVGVSGITLVMVTHDVGLKFFADRIIWMRDGKIQRVETVSSRRQAEMVAELDRDLEVRAAQQHTGL
jgi:putative ABC transport system ATP-binding protein